MENFNVYLQRVDLNAFRKYCEEHGVVVKYRAGEHFARRGYLLRRWGFVTKGLFTYSVADNNGNEHIVGFAFQDALVGDYHSVAVDRQAICDIVAATDCEVIVCETSKFKDLLKRDGNALRITLSENLFEEAYTRLIDLYALTPKERYQKLLSKCPDLLQYISLKQLASYLKITPTHLSRIRKEITFSE